MVNTDTNEAKTEPLKFEDDPKSSRSFWIALLLLLGVVGWLVSGFILPAPPPSEESQSLSDRAIEPMAVIAETSIAKPVVQFFKNEGQALPDRDTTLRAQTSGQISEVYVKKGEDVEANDVVAKFDTKELEAELERAQAELERAQREVENAIELQERGVATADRVSSAEAALAGARAQLAFAEDNLANTSITAPFAGRIETFELDPGEFIQVGSEIGRLVDNSPLTVAIQVPQISLGVLKNQQPARVKFITGEERAGLVTFVSTSATTATRTFLVEVEVSNSDGKIPAGISAEVEIPYGQVDAHFISPETLSLNEQGALGVKTVDDDNVVRFHNVEVIRATIEGLFVTGLPDEVQIITTGQGFVQDGELVNPQKGADN